jgi:TonB family protein
VAQAEHDCADRVPLAGSASNGDALVVQTIVAIEHRDLMRHFRGSATTVTTVRVAPPPPPMMSLGAGVTCPRPDYPPAAVRALVHGATRVRLTVDADGHVTDGEVVGASGPTREHRLLDDTAAASLRGCQFPKVEDKAPRVVTLAYEWRLN